MQAGEQGAATAALVLTAADSFICYLKNVYSRCGVRGLPGYYLCLKG
jgi:hypothetical protein